MANEMMSWLCDSIFDDFSLWCSFGLALVLWAASACNEIANNSEPVDVLMPTFGVLVRVVFSAMNELDVGWPETKWKIVPGVFIFLCKLLLLCQSCPDDNNDKFEKHQYKSSRSCAPFHLFLHLMDTLLAFFEMVALSCWWERRKPINNVQRSRVQHANHIKIVNYTVYCYWRRGTHYLLV